MLGSARRNRRKEYEKLVTPWFNALYASALRLTRNERNAEDLVQDAVLRGWRFYDRFEQGTNFRAWLFRILTNTFINSYRRSTRENALQKESERQAIAARFFSSDLTEQASNPEAFIIERLMSEDVLKAIDGLPITFRLVVILADIQEFNYKEISDILDIPVGTVMSRLFRGRQQLQRALRGAPEEHDQDLPNAAIDLNTYRERKKSA